MVEVADGLVVVQGQDQTDAVGHGRQWVRYSMEGCQAWPVDVAVVGLSPRDSAISRVERHVNGNNSLIGNHTPVYPVCLAGIFCGSGNSTSTSRRKAAACSGGTGLM